MYVYFIDKYFKIVFLLFFKEIVKSVHNLIKKTKFFLFLYTFFLLKGSEKHL
jgi:hypothetical protein